MTGYTRKCGETEYGSFVNRHKEWKQRKPGEWRGRTPTPASKSTASMATWVMLFMAIYSNAKN